MAVETINICSVLGRLARSRLIWSRPTSSASPTRARAKTAHRKPWESGPSPDPVSGATDPSLTVAVNHGRNSAISITTNAVPVTRSPEFQPDEDEDARGRVEDAGDSLVIVHSIRSPMMAVILVPRIRISTHMHHPVPVQAREGELRPLPQSQLPFFRLALLLRCGCWLRASAGSHHPDRDDDDQERYRVEDRRGGKRQRHAVHQHVPSLAYRACTR